MAPKSKRINEGILNQRVQVITESGENLGVLSRADALRKGEELSLDLVEMSEKDGVSLAKLMDYGKFTFKQQKNLSKNKTLSKKTNPKTLRLTYTIGDHDMEVRKNQCIGFAKSNYPLKVTMMLKGRENQYERLAREKMEEFVTSLSEVYKLEGQITKAGNVIHAMLSPKK